MDKNRWCNILPPNYIPLTKINQLEIITKIKSNARNGYNNQNLRSLLCSYIIYNIRHLCYKVKTLSNLSIIFSFNSVNTKY